MKAVILAAGLGKRLRPLTDLLPKPLQPIGGRPILGTLLAGLSKAGVQDVRIVVGHLGGMIRAFAGDGADFGVRVGYTEQAEQRGTAHALLQAAEFIDDVVMVLAGDTAFSPEHLRRLGEFHEAEKADVSLCLKRVAPEVMARTSSVKLLPDGRVADFAEKPKPGEAPGDLGAGLLHIYPAGLVDYLGALRETSRGEIELTQATRAMIADGLRVMGLLLPTPPDLTDHRDFLRLNFDYTKSLLEHDVATDTGTEAKR
jgi:NDP-sugar pyrophosphorylase family protein